MKKIVVVGVSASGKSYFSRLLAQKLQLPLYHMDAIMWQPTWKYVGEKETVQKLEQLSSGDAWIIEGYISSSARMFLFDRADLIVHLDYPRIICVWRYLKRWWKHRAVPRPELEGSPEKFSFKFLWLVWTKGEDVSLKKILRNNKVRTKLIILESPKVASLFVESL